VWVALKKLHCFEKISEQAATMKKKYKNGKTAAKHQQ